MRWKHNLVCLMLVCIFTLWWLQNKNSNHRYYFICDTYPYSYCADILQKGDGQQMIRFFFTQTLSFHYCCHYCVSLGAPDVIIFDNFWCSYSWKFRQNADIFVSVCEAVASTARRPCWWWMWLSGRGRQRFMAESRWLTGLKWLWKTKNLSYAE